MLKRAANLRTWHGVPLGCLIYGASAILWYMGMRHMKLVTFAIFFPVINCVCVAALGMWGFKERVSPMEWVALTLSIVVLIIMGRVTA